MVALSIVSGSGGFADRVFGLIDKVECRPAESAEERDAIYRLRYDAYLAEDAIQPSPGCRLSDGYDYAENTWILGVHVERQLVSSIRLTVSTPTTPTMPALQVFSDVLSPVTLRGGVMIDPTRFVVSREARRSYPELPYVTTRLAWLACEFFKADLLLATVRSEHRAFYRRFFRHQAICEGRPYPNLKKPINLMAVDYIAEQETVNRRCPFFQSNRQERQLLFDRRPKVAAA